MHIIKRALIAGVALAAPIAVGAAPAAAASSSSASCTVMFGRGCVTTPVDSVSGMLRLSLFTPAATTCGVQVRNVGTGSVPYRGTFSGTAYATTLGAPGSYRLELVNCPVGARGTISG
ncbi:MAG: hypothetical protein ABW156_14015 [Jiangellaceae bacterium]